MLVNGDVVFADFDAGILTLSHKCGKFVAVPRSVDDIDFTVFISNADVFGENGNAAFPFNVIIVQETFLHFLIVTEDFRLFDDLVHQGRLPVVDVRDNRDVSDFLHNFCFSSAITITY